MSGQPATFSVRMVLAKEIPAPGAPKDEPPTTILVNNTLTLKTYLNVNDSSSMVNNFVEAAVTGGTLTYYFEDLDSGGIPIKKSGGPIKTLSSDDVKIAFGIPTNQALNNPHVVKDELKDSGLSPDGIWFLSDPSAEIKSGTAAGDLVVPAGETGCWRVLTAVWGGPVLGKPSQVAAHNDDFLIQVYSP